MTTVEILRAARALITDPANWTTRAPARDSKGRTCSSKDDDACRFCALGALWRFEDKPDAAETATEAENLLDVAAEEMGETAIGVNDRAGHGEVLAMYDRAIVLAESR